MEIKPAKKWHLIGRLSLFMAGPVIAFTYAHLPLSSVMDYCSIMLAAAWLYLSVEDTFNLSVPAYALYLVGFSTLIFAIMQQKEIFDYLLITSSLACIFCTVWCVQRLRKKMLMGPADLIAIVSLGFTLPPQTLGLWIIIACALPLIGMIANRELWSQKIPFIPYLTASWLLVSILD
jgi:low temperature requirement protein LtrA